MSAITSAVTATSVRAFPGVAGRLLRADSAPEDLAAYLAIGGHAAVADADRLLAVIESAGLRGRGGAAFPTGGKMRAVRERAGVPVVVANGEEGEPASVKDRWLLRNRPHLVLDGLRLAARVVGTTEAVVYVSDPASAASIDAAVAELVGQESWDLSIRVVTVAATYVAGEETAAVQAINGGPAVPTDKPPRPYESGVSGRPTLVSNVETLAQLPLVLRLGALGYRRAGTPTSPGTFLMTLSGMGRAGLLEVPFGVTLGEVLAWVGEDPAEVSGALMGGYFAGVAGRHVLTTPLDPDALRGIGSGLGCGAVGLLGPGDCPVEVSAAVMAYFARENARQCGSCFNGTTAMSEVLEALRIRAVTDEQIEHLRGWSVSLRGRGACGTLDGAANVAASVLADFPRQVADHLAGRCVTCDDGRTTPSPPFATGLVVADRTA